MAGPTITTTQTTDTLAYMIAKPVRKGLFRRTGSLLRLSALLCVGLPTVITGIYEGLVASDQFVSEIRFAVRSKEGSVQASPSLLSSLTLPASATNTAIVADYLKSRDAVDDVSRRHPLTPIYANPKADWFARFDASQPIEEFIRYWRGMVDVRLESTSDSITVGVRAFTAEDARTVATDMLLSAEALVNRMSERARAEAVRHAEQDVQITEERLKKALTALAAFRAEKRLADPGRKAGANQDLAAKIQAEWTQTDAQLTSARRLLSADAPQVQMLEIRKQAIEQAMRRVQAEETPGADLQPMPDVLKRYEELRTEHDFAEKAYTAAMAELEHARSQASQQQLFVNTFVTPRLAQEPLYPKRLLNTATVFAFALLLWAIGCFVVATVRDHMR
jgi:capsular polysaccharide transport system permease protein